MKSSNGRIAVEDNRKLNRTIPAGNDEAWSSHDTRRADLTMYCHLVDAFEVARQVVRRLAVNCLDVVRIIAIPMSGGYFP